MQFYSARSVGNQSVNKEKLNHLKSVHKNKHITNAAVEFRLKPFSLQFCNRVPVCGVDCRRFAKETGKE